LIGVSVVAFHPSVLIVLLDHPKWSRSVHRGVLAL
jgi:hypothetical protein